MRRAAAACVQQAVRRWRLLPRAPTSPVSRRTPPRKTPLPVAAPARAAAARGGGGGAAAATAGLHAALGATYGARPGREIVDLR